MTTGEGVFFGLVFIGLVWLFVATKDRWKWRRIAAWSAMIIATPVLGVGIWVGLVQYREARPQVATEFWGLSTGISIDEVKYRKGEPDSRKGETNSSESSYWIYGTDSDNVVYAVQFRNSKVRAIEALTFGEKTVFLPSLQGISNFSSLGDIEKKFGTPDLVSTSKDGARRLVSYLKYGLLFSLEKDRVVTLGILDPSEGPLEYAK